MLGNVELKIVILNVIAKLQILDCDVKDHYLVVTTKNKITAQCNGKNQITIKKKIQQLQLILNGRNKSQSDINKEKRESNLLTKHY